ncbi:MAG: hypothetical protein ABJ327_03275 [Litoreibacter sp.]
MSWRQPLIIASIFVTMNIGFYFIIRILNYGTLFSLEYLFYAMLLPGAVMPMFLIAYGIVKRTWVWWSVLLGCCISMATSVIHFYLIAAVNIGV